MTRPQAIDSVSYYERLTHLVNTNKMSLADLHHAEGQAIAMFTLSEPIKEVLADKKDIVSVGRALIVDTCVDIRRGLQEDSDVKGTTQEVIAEAARILTQGTIFAMNESIAAQSKHTHRNAYETSKTVCTIMRSW